jgi:hypothetical protein
MPLTAEEKLLDTIKQVNWGRVLAIIKNGKIVQVEKTETLNEQELNNTPG